MDIYGLDDRNVGEKEGRSEDGINYDPEAWDNFSFGSQIYEYDPEKQVTWSTLLVSSCSLLLSGLLVAVCALFLGAPADSKQGVLREFFSIYEKVTEAGLFNSVVGPIRLIFFFGIVTLLVSAFTILAFRRFRGIEKSKAYVKHPRKMIVLRLYTISVLVLGCLSGAFSIPLFTSTKGLANAPLDGPDSERSNTPEQLMMDYENAIFNTCCHANGWAEHDAIAECTYNINADCSFLTGDLASFKDLLCTCVENQNFYNKFVSSIIESDLCANLERARVTVTRDLELPGTTYSLGFIIELLYGAELFAGINEATIPVVGFHRADAANEDKQFGCGIGFAKGFMFITQLFGQQSGSLEITLITAASFGQIGLGMICFLCYRVAGLESGDNDRAYMGMGDKNDNDSINDTNKNEEKGNEIGHYISAPEIDQNVANGVGNSKRDSFRDSLLSSLSSHSERNPILSKTTENHAKLVKRKKRFIIGEFVGHLKRPEFDEEDEANPYHPIPNEDTLDVDDRLSLQQGQGHSVRIPQSNEKATMREQKRVKKKLAENFLENFRRPSFDKIDGDYDINLDDF